MGVFAQDIPSDLFARVNSLRTSQGLSSYSRNGSLNAAAQNHARWMVDTGQVSHTQSNGSSPRDRARAAGYSSTWVSENIYMGPIAGINDAWNFWLNSPIHYAGLTSPNYDQIGIGFANGPNGNAFVLVFGNSSGRVAVPPSNNNGVAADEESTIPQQPPYVVGIDARGYIMHELQPGHTLGDVALIYGYSWDIIPEILAVNELTEDDIRVLEIGSVILVPPQAGTYTPTPVSATKTPTPEPTNIPIAMNTPAISRTPNPPTSVPTQIPSPTVEMVVRVIPTTTPIPTATPVVEETPPPPIDNRSPILFIALAVQVGILGAATVEFIRRMRR